MGEPVHRPGSFWLWRREVLSGSMVLVASFASTSAERRFSGEGRPDSRHPVLPSRESLPSAEELVVMISSRAREEPLRLLARASPVGGSRAGRKIRDRCSDIRHDVARPL